MRKIVIIALGVIVVGFMSWRIFTLVTAKDQSGASGKGGKPPVAVEVANPSHERIEDIRQFTGTVYPIYQYVVAPKVSGRVVEIRKRIGDPVRKGEVIARIDNAEYEQAVLEAEANLTIGEASLAEIQGQAELARQELERVQSLREKGIASTSELDAAVSGNTAQQARLKLARAQVEQRKAALNSARIRLGYTVLAATEPGFIGDRFVDEGALLSPNSPVVTVVGIDRVIVRTTIIERDYGKIRMGQETTVQVDAFPSDAFSGKVARIAPMLEESARVAKMEVEVNNPIHRLKPGMFARVNVMLAAKDDAQVIPASAIVTGTGAGGGSGVFVVSAGEKPAAKYVAVETGIVTQEKAEIVSPALDGAVVTLGQHLLSDGSPVILPGAEGEKGGGKGGKKEPGR